VARTSIKFGIGLSEMKKLEIRSAYNSLSFSGDKAFVIIRLAVSVGTIR